VAALILATAPTDNTVAAIALYENGQTGPRTALNTAIRVRHPQLAALFWWSLGSQLILCNPIMLAGVVVHTHSTLADAIIAEETHLGSYHQAGYLEYKKKSHTGIPFVEGYDPTDGKAQKKNN
jgi:protein-S-isoprenylcysteine O-methyltransferase Ste14